MKNSIILLSVCAAMTCCTAPDTTVHLHGQLIDMGSTNVTMQYDGAESMIGDSRDIILHTDNEGRFDTVFTLTKPTYFDISRNTLYLTPGDDLTVRITTNNSEAQFSGKGAEVNDYMKYRLFPKGGSYLEGGSNIHGDFATTKVLIDSLAAERRAQLSALKEASDEFKRLEGARIDADVVNSFLMYPSYAFSYRRDITTREQYMKAVNAANKEILPLVKSLLPALMHDELLNVAVVRDVLSYIAQPEDDDYKYLAEDLTMSPYMQEIYKAAGFVAELRHGVSEEKFSEVKAYLETMQYPACKVELEAKLAQAAKLMKGSPAIDFEMQDVDGNVHKLSDLKGKVIYLDFWATWCGACIEESPYFEQLAKEFHGQNVVFVPVSTDRSTKVWHSYLKGHKKELVQYNTTDRLLTTGWAMFYIPRFIVIDKDFKIVDAYAPRPSQPEAKVLLQSLLSE